MKSLNLLFCHQRIQKPLGRITQHTVCRKFKDLSTQAALSSASQEALWNYAQCRLDESPDSVACSVWSHTLACLQGSQRNEWGDLNFLNVWVESLDPAPRSPPCAVSPFMTLCRGPHFMEGKKGGLAFGRMLCAHIFSSLLHKHQFVNTDLLFIDSLCPVSHCPCPWPSKWRQKSHIREEKQATFPVSAGGAKA